AAVLTGYSERLALKAQARQYDRMQTLFGRAYELLPPEINTDTMGLAYTLYHELGMEAMKGNAEWGAIYRPRPIEPLNGSSSDCFPLDQILKLDLSLGGDFGDAVDILHDSGVIHAAVTLDFLLRDGQSKPLLDPIGLKTHVIAQESKQLPARG